MSGQEDDIIEIVTEPAIAGDAGQSAGEQPAVEQPAAAAEQPAEAAAGDASVAGEEQGVGVGVAAVEEQQAPAAGEAGAAAEAGGEPAAAADEAGVAAMDAEQQAPADGEGEVGAATAAAAAPAADQTGAAGAPAVVPPPLPIRPAAQPPAAAAALPTAGEGGPAAAEQPHSQQAAAGAAAGAAAEGASQPAGSEQPAEGAAEPPKPASPSKEQAGGGKPAAEPAGAPGGAAEKPVSGPQRNLAALHKEVDEFAEEAQMTAGERKRREVALQAVKDAADAAFPTATRRAVQAFGSFAHGVSLPGADLDVVVSGIMTPISRGGGFTSEQRELLGPLLKRLSNKLQEAGAVRKRPLIIFNARVPIIKAESSEGVRLDICLNTDEGPKAAAWLAEQCAAFPVLRPLCLVIRGLLAEQRLGEAATGGLSNWALCSMVLALLLEQRKASLPVSNAGHLLLGFLKYYGRVFELEDQAVAPGQGGIISRDDLPASAQSNAPKTLPSGKQPPPKLCVVDPLTGRDVAGGTHRISQVRACFKDAASKLELLLKQDELPPGGFLPFLFNVDAALKRAKPSAHAAPSAHATHAAHGAPAGSGSKLLMGVPTAPRGEKRAQEGPPGGEGGGKRLHREVEGGGPPLRGKGPGGRGMGPGGPRAAGPPGGGFFSGPGPGRGGGGWERPGPGPQGGRGYGEPAFDRRGPGPGRGSMGGRGGMGRPPYEEEYLPPQQQRGMGPAGYGPGPGRQPGMGQPGMQQGGMGMGGGMGAMPQQQMGMGLQVQQPAAAAGMMAQVQQLASLPPQQLQQLLALAQQAQQAGQAGQPGMQQAGVMGLQGGAGMMAPQQGLGMPQQQALVQPGLTMDQQALLLASQQLLMQQQAAGAVPQMQQGVLQQGAGGMGMGQPQGMLQQMAPQQQVGGMLMGGGGGTGMPQMQQQGGMMMPQQAQQQYGYGGGY